MTELMMALWLTMAAAPPADTVPLYDNLGSHHYSITTSEPAAQRYFDQGLRLYYAFNHAESIRSFREAQRLDPTCAMCWWGEALAWGPNINLPMDSASGVAAYAAIERARAVQEHASERERALIRALASRYERVPSADRSALDSAYARAMADVTRQYPQDPEAAVLHAESLMDLRPWDYWLAEDRPAPGMDVALAQLERIIETNQDHPGACHFFIHAVEELHPDRAVPCAERLAALMPGAGHVVHMPGHIYIRVGRYMDAVEANHHALHADETYIRDQRPGMNMYTAGYYPHNYDFLAFAETMTGRSAAAAEAARRLAELVPADMLGLPGYGFLQHWVTRPLQVAIRYGRWQEILDAPAPDPGHRHASAMWHYARGRALAATGQVDEGARHLASLEEIAGDPDMAQHRLEFNTSAAVLAIAVEVLAGKLALASGDVGRALTHLRQAVRNEDALVYGEPPEWTIPARHDLGAALLDAGRTDEAEAVYREDLRHFRENGWSLTGLRQSLLAQGRAGDAEQVGVRLRRAWDAADVEIEGSAF